ncbi:hypothetical protein FD754_012803 [Muntiacus muntjak]|uniref:Phospholipid phosphatase-related protein type 1 n=1 Tax=Muntiacus muntjak TaxID=9888 RepID=A0A5N3VIL4_MUNMU|nr:hypothetical protein FD754_012803 [Muntiacus muntjak]
MGPVGTLGLNQFYPHPSLLTQASIAPVPWEVPGAALLKLHQIHQNELFGKQMLVKPSGEADIIQGRPGEKEKATFSNRIHIFVQVSQGQSYIPVEFTREQIKSRKYSLPTGFLAKQIKSAWLSRAHTAVLVSGTKTNLWCMSPFLIALNLLVGVFAFGLFATDIFVNAGQVVTGHLTPYFLTVCKPNYTSTDCQAHHQFINNGNICTGDLEVIEKARRSFPSKHAALSIYSALYATMYITSTIKTKSSRLAKPVLCLGTLCTAFLTGLNRVSEYRNHCSDVIAGFILGTAVALFLGMCVVHNFKGTQGSPSKPKPEDPRGVPLMAFPRVESPLETLSAQALKNFTASLN